MRSRGKGIALSYIYTISNTIIGLFMSAYILRMLGQTEYGIYQTMTSFVTYLTLFQFGTGTIMTRNISLCKKDGSERNDIQKNVSTVWSITCALALVILLVSFIFYISIDSIYVHSLTDIQRQYGKIIFSVAVIKMTVEFFIQTINGIILGCEHYSIGSIVSITTLFLRTIVVVIGLYLNNSAILLVCIDSVISVSTFLFISYYCKNKLSVKLSFKYFDKEIFHTMLPLAVALFLQTIVNMANNNVDKFVIGVVFSPEAVSVYSIAMFIFSTFSSLTTIPISMYMPQIASNMRDGKNGKELTESLVPACRLVVLIGGAVLFGFISVGRPFISIVYGNDYNEAWLIAVIIMIPMFINMTNGVLVNVLDVLKKRHVRSICLGITAIGNIVLTIWWIHCWGMIGAAVATALCTLIGQIILMNIYYAKVIHIDIIHLFKQAYRGLLPGLMLSSVFSLTFNLFCQNDYINLCIGGLIFAVSFFGSILLLKSNSVEKNLLINMVKEHRFMGGNEK